MGIINSMRVYAYNIFHGKEIEKDFHCYYLSGIRKEDTKSENYKI